MESIDVITANLGCGGPCSEARVEWARAWTIALIDTCVDILFLQETPRDGLSATFTDAFDVFTCPPGVRVFPPRSLVAVRRATGLQPTSFHQIPNAAYHGSYLAGAQIDLPSVGPVVCVSVHASPSHLRDADLAKWEGAHPTPRVGGGRNANELWDSDYVLDTLAGLRANHTVLACGDLNEARGWDTHHENETWGLEYFRKVTSAGFEDCLDGVWHEERPTRADYQIDHVLASPTIAKLIDRAELASGPDVDGDRSDHTPIWFRLTTSVPAVIAG